MKDFENYLKTKVDKLRYENETHKGNPYWAGKLSAAYEILNKFYLLVKDRPF